MLLRLEKMVHGGVALARLSGGRLALVRGGIPGERVKVNLKERAGVLQGAVAEIVDASPHRTSPSEHPGLDYSHIAYPHQLELKRDVVKDALARALKPADLPSVLPVVAAPAPWGYRHAAQPAVARGAPLADGAVLGYRRPESHEVVPLGCDPVATPALNGAWARVQALGLPKGVREVAFRTNDVGKTLLCLIASASARNYLSAAHKLLGETPEGGEIVGVAYAPFDPRGRFRSGTERLAGARLIRQRYGSFELSVSATGFAQPNPAAASRLYAELTRWAGEGQLALDLYAGGGVIGMHLAASFARVVALELDRGSVVRGARDAARLGLANLEFHQADARRLGALPEAELICVNPPRAGLAKGTRAVLNASAATRLLYVSCDVATFARDAAQLCAAGWRLARLEPFDFYPQTHHVELLSLFERASP
jgi:23S rRNA (uracil1939-C5)-methyltransferase